MLHWKFKAILQYLKPKESYTTNYYGRVKGRIDTNLDLDYIVRFYLKVSLLIKVCFCIDI